MIRARSVHTETLGIQVEMFQENSAHSCCSFPIITKTSRATLLSPLNTLPNAPQPLDRRIGSITLNEKVHNYYDMVISTLNITLGRQSGQ